MSAYTLDTTAATAGVHHRMMAHMFDPFTLSRLEELTTLDGATVLDVGAGHGCLAVTLADRVGPAGHVYALDAHPRVPAHERITTITHDLTDPGPLPVPVVDVAHARLVLEHLPEREDILDRMIDVVRPGGLVLVQDWCGVRRQIVVAAPDAPAADLYGRYILAAGRMFEAAGLDRQWATRIDPAMVARGLADVSTVVHGTYWRGGGPGMTMIAAVVPQIRDGLLSHGMTVGELDRLPAVLADPRLVVQSHFLYSTAGRRR